jgi:hypothetical protein
MGSTEKSAATLQTMKQPRLRYAAASLAFASQLIHLWLLPSEFVARPLSGSFMLLVAVCQGLLAVSLLFGPGKWVTRFGILLNACVVLTWVLRRFVEFPPVAGFPRLPVEPHILAATAAETLLLVLLFGIAREIKQKQSRMDG